MNTTIRHLALLGLLSFAAPSVPGQDAVPQPATEVNAALSLHQAKSNITAHIAAPRFSEAQWGILIASLDSGLILFDHNSHKLLKPASNAKLYSGALALDLFGPDWTTATSIYAKNGPDTDGVLACDLLVYGRGDFSMAARFNNGDYSQSLQPIVRAIESAGIKRIKGNLIGDDSFFRVPSYGSGWTWEDLQYYYGAPASALVLEDNVVDLIISPALQPGIPCRIETRPATDFLQFINRTETSSSSSAVQFIQLHRPLGDSSVWCFGRLPVQSEVWTDAVSVPNPALWFVHQLRRALTEAGIIVEGQLQTVNALDRDLEPFVPMDWIELGRVQSRPLKELLPKMMKPSQNLYAQLLLLHAGVQMESLRTNQPSGYLQTTEEEGLNALWAFLEKAGIHPLHALLEEGSGLSRAALVTPAATVQLLKFMKQHQYSDYFNDALPIAGVDGTLRSRMRNTPAEGNLRAKTGTIRYVNTLSGYVTTQANERLVFSIMLNAYKPPIGFSGRADIDQIAVWLAELDEHTGGREPPSGHP